MKTRQYTPDTMDKSFVCLGKQGEGKHLALAFDVALWREEYPEAEVLLWVTPPDGDGYFAALEEREGDAIWIVMQADTAHAGSGEIELILRDTETDTTIKSVTARTLIKASSSHKEGAEPPHAHKPWWERLLDMISGVVRSINGVKPDADGNINIEVIGGGSTINDNAPSTNTTYSSTKIEELNRAKVNQTWGAAYAGKLLYIGADGIVTALTLGAGLAIVNGVLTITSAPVTAAICGQAVCGETICGG